MVSHRRAIAALGQLISGALLEQFEWGSVFLVTLPLAVVALLMAFLFVPSHINETTGAVDNLGGVLSLVMVGSLILSINFAPVPNETALVLVLGGITLATAVGFYLRQRRASNPLYDLDVAAGASSGSPRAGIIVFGSLMGAAFISQQYLQNVLDYSTLEAGASILPAALMMVIVAPRSAKLVEARGARFTLLCGYVFLVLAFLSMLLLWKEDTAYWKIAIAYAFIGIGVGFAGTPASHSLTGSVPVTRAGMASGTADLQRDLGGAIMQSIFGALLTAGYAAAAGAAIAASDKNVTDSTQAQLTKSFAGAEDVAAQHPQYADAIISGAKTAFLQGDQWAYTAGLVAVLGGAALVFFIVPEARRRAAAAGRLPRGGHGDEWLTHMPSRSLQRCQQRPRYGWSGMSDQSIDRSRLPIRRPPFGGRHERSTRGLGARLEPGGARRAAGRGSERPGRADRRRRLRQPQHLRGCDRHSQLTRAWQATRELRYNRFHADRRVLADACGDARPAANQHRVGFGLVKPRILGTVPGQ